MRGAQSGRDRPARGGGPRPFRDGRNGQLRAASDDHRGIVEEPLLIVEILSPSTDRDDVFVKLPAYQRIPSLQEILYVETERVGARVYRRVEDGWLTIEHAVGDARLQLDTVGLDIALGSLYRGIPGLSP